MRGTGTNHTLPEEILAPEDIKGISSAATNPRNRAMVAVLYESGCRIGEFLGLKLKNVEFDIHGAVIIVSGKTGMRRVRVSVLPVPAPATTRKYRFSDSTAFFCSSVRCFPFGVSSMALRISSLFIRSKLRQPPFLFIRRDNIKPLRAAAREWFLNERFSQLAPKWTVRIKK